MDEREIKDEIGRLKEEHQKNDEKIEELEAEKKAALDKTELAIWACTYLSGIAKRWRTSFRDLLEWLVSQYDTVLQSLSVYQPRAINHQGLEADALQALPSAFLGGYISQQMQRSCVWRKALRSCIWR